MALRKLDVVIRAKDVFSKVMTRAQRGALRVAKAFSIMSRALKKVRKVVLLVAAAIAGLGFGLFKLVSSTAKAGDELQKMALRTGLSAQALSEFKHAAEISGSSLETFEKGMKTLSKRISDARFGLQTYVRIFDKLGIAYQTTGGELREVDDVFMDAITAINQLGSDTEKAALAQELFGRAGTQLLPMIKAGATEISKLRAEARLLGITFDEMSATQAAEYVDAMTRLKSGFRGIFNIIGKELIPVFTLWATTATTKIKELLADGTINRWATQIKTAVERIGRTINTLGKAFGIFMRFFGVETRSALEVVNTQIVTWEKAQERGIVNLQNQSVAAKIYNDLLIERNRLEIISLGIKKKLHIINIAVPLNGTEPPPFKAAQGPGVIVAQGGGSLMEDALGPTLLGMDTRLGEMASFHNKKIAQMIAEGKSEGDILAQRAQKEYNMLNQTEQMKQQLRQKGFGMATNVMRNLFVATGSHSKALFEMTKVLAVSQALIDAKSAILGSYKVGARMGGPILGTAFAAAAAAATAAQIRGIISQRMGGGSESVTSIGGGVPVSQGGVRPIPTRNVADQPQAQNITLIINNPLSTQNWDEITENDIIPAINAAAKRSVNVTVRTVAA